MFLIIFPLEIYFKSLVKHVCASMCFLFLTMFNFFSRKEFSLTEPTLMLYWSLSTCFTYYMTQGLWIKVGVQHLHSNVKRFHFHSSCHQPKGRHWCVRDHCFRPFCHSLCIFSSTCHCSPLQESPPHITDPSGKWTLVLKFVLGE